MREKISKLDRILEQTEKAGITIAGGAIVAMIVFVLLAVLGRYAFHVEIIPGNYAIVESYLMPLVVFLGFAFTYRSGAFPRLEFVVERLPQAMQRPIQLVCLTVELIIFSTVLVYTWQYALKGVARGISVLAGVKLIPLYPVLFLMPVGFALLLLEVIFTIWKTAKSGPTIDAK